MIREVRRGSMRRVAWVGGLLGLILAAMPGGAFASNEIGGPAHWAYASNPDAYVTIVDFTGSNWPVYAAAINWDGGSTNFDVIYQNGSCNDFGHCVSVDTATQSPACLESGGFAALFLTPAGNHLGSDSYIELNSKCGSSAFSNRDRQALICEEEGHIIGLAHAVSSLNDETCMASGKITQLHEEPRPHDFYMIDSVMYAHNH